MINVTRSSMPPYDEYCEEIKDIWESRWLTNSGIKHQTLESELCNFLKCDNTTLFVNGHLALEIAIDAFGLSGEVITTPFTFASTTNAIVRNGLTPVFCDVNKNDYTIDADKIESLITEKTSAIIPVHVYGNICNYKKIDEIAKKYNLKVIYDAAHAFGVEIDGKGVATLGDASMFSFHATKVFNTIEGGAICCGNKYKSMIDKMFSLKNFGLVGKEDVEYVGGNAKMNEFSAAMGLCNLRHLDEEIAKRKAVHDRYFERLSDIKGIKLSQTQNNVISNYAYFPVIFDGYKYNRDEVAQLLSKNDIFARKYFYPITNTFNAFKDKFIIQPTPVALDLSKKVLTLPMYADLSVEDVDKICDIIL